MNHTEELIVFGPVPSRRLGQSMGINNIPAKNCSYSCIYCQLGNTYHMQGKRSAFYNPETILNQVTQKISQTRNNGEPIDFLTFVADGEPTIDSNLGKEIEMLKPLGIKIAVISNASFLWQDQVQDELSKADWVSVKIDATSQDIWKKINGPYKSFNIDNILEGIQRFSIMFSGELSTETMLIHGFNDSDDELEKISDFIATIRHKKSYISIPTRPPAKTWVKPASEKKMNQAFHIFKSKKIDTEYLIDYEGNTFAFTGDIEKDILSITSVHPMRKDGVHQILSKANADWNIITTLIKKGKLVEVVYKNEKFYLRKFSRIS